MEPLLVSDSQGAATYDQGYADASSQYDRAGMYVDGHWVSNIYPYDAAGRPLVGVQLFDQTGQPVGVEPQTECVYDSAEVPVDKGRVYYPWSTAAGQATNVFPVPSRVQGPDTPDPDPTAFAGANRPGVGRFPLTQVPAATLPGLAVSKATTPKKAVPAGRRAEAARQPDRQRLLISPRARSADSLVQLPFRATSAVQRPRIQSARVNRPRRAAQRDERWVVQRVDRY